VAGNGRDREWQEVAGTGSGRKWQGQGVARSGRDREWQGQKTTVQDGSTALVDQDQSAAIATPPAQSPHAAHSHATWVRPHSLVDYDSVIAGD
jgi:hypothetical protein